MKYWAITIDTEGKRCRLFADGSQAPYRFYHAWASSVSSWWYGHDWRSRQAAFRKAGTRYYGDGGTIHGSTGLNVEMCYGEVVAVWFRCQHLPFNVTHTDWQRADEMRRLYRQPLPEIHGVEVKDPAPSNPE